MSFTEACIIMFRKLLNFKTVEESIRENQEMYDRLAKL